MVSKAAVWRIYSNPSVIQQSLIGTVRRNAYLSRAVSSCMKCMCGCYPSLELLVKQWQILKELYSNGLVFYILGGGGVA